jgi:hypothetical protein
MANTYTLISSTTVTVANATTITFSSIPATYTDLELKVSARKVSPAGQNSDFLIRFNSDTTTLYSTTRIIGNGATAASDRQSNTSAQVLTDVVSGSASTANTFGTFAMYIPNYTSTGNKPASAFGANENFTTTAYILGHAGLYRGTSGISSIDVTTSSQNYVIGSSFYLYGIKKS